MRNKDAPLISVEDLKLLVYKESGYKIQISGDDPFLTMVYTNLAVLGESLKAAGQLQESAIEQINKLPGAADKEMKRAGEAAINSLATEVGRIAQRIAGDTAEAEKANAISLAVKWASCGVVACAVVFGGTGYTIHALADKVNLKSAQSKLIESYAREEAAVAAAEKKSDLAIAAAEKKSHDEIEEMRKNSGWLGTAEGRLAKKFFDLGNGVGAAKCESLTWYIKERNGERICIPKRRNWFGKNDEEFGWKIP